ncbi:MAG: 2Fe-2S iron-sulfur cluster-binding protein, partial [Catalinimonas sp.]
MKVLLKIWRQAGPDAPGELRDYPLDGLQPAMSFLEALDLLNERLIERGERPVAFDHDCREGICGTCGLFIDGQAHGPLPGTTTCQLHMRSFEDGAT